MTDGIMFIEGFDGDESSLVWEQMPLVRSGDHVRTGTVGVGYNSTGSSARAHSPLFEGTAELILGFAFRWQDTTALTSDLLFCELRSRADVPSVAIGLTPQYTLSLWANNSLSGTGYNPVECVRAFSTFTLDEGAWYYIEVYAERHSSNGRVVVQVNGPPGTPGTTGAEVLDVSGIPTGATTVAAGSVYNQFRLGVLESGGGNKHISFDDIYVRDASVGGFLGDQGVYAIDLEDDRSVDFTRLSGAKNYLMVNETAPDDDTTYNETDTTEAVDVFEIGTDVFTGDIHCVQLVARTGKTDAEAWSVQTLIELNATRAYGPVRFIAQDYETLPPDVYGDAPGGTGWTLADLGDLGVGYRALRDGVEAVS